MMLNTARPNATCSRETVELLNTQKTHSEDDNVKLTFLFQVTFQCNKIFIEDKINLRAVGLEKGLQFLSFGNICEKTKGRTVTQTITRHKTQ